MATAALAQEKVWFDKPSYDKAERQYFEKLAKVIPCKIMDNCTSNTNINNKLQDSNNTNGTKSKSKKCKDNKSVENGSNDVKQSKSQSKHKNNKKEDHNNMLKIDPTEQKEKTPHANVKEEETNNINEIPDKNKAKQAKEEKNKADKKHRNKEKKEQLPAKEQKEQLPVKANQQTTCPLLPAGGSLANEVAKARQHIKQSLQCMDDIAAFAGVGNQSDLPSRVATLERENQDLRNVVQELRNVIGKLEERVQALEEQPPSWARIAICPPKPESPPQEQTTKKNDDDDEDIDFFASDSEGEDEEAAKVREERLAAYAAKKSKKPALIAKSNIILDVKPWDDETDMKVMEAEVRKIEMDGLLWGAAKLVPLAYSICKLQISCVVEDDKVSVDALTEQIEALEDYVQSVDIAAFNKV